MDTVPSIIAISVGSMLLGLMLGIMVGGFLADQDDD